MNTTKTHHPSAAVRSRGFFWGHEVEKPGLLPLRPAEEDRADVGRGTGVRRPADVWLAQWGVHGLAALDLAVTSGLRAGATVAQSAMPPSRRTRPTSAPTCTLRSTAPLKVPLVAEACSGGWGPTAAATWRVLGGLIAARSGDSPSVETDRLLQLPCIVKMPEQSSAACPRRRSRRAPSVSPELSFAAVHAASAWVCQATAASPSSPPLLVVSAPGFRVWGLGLRVGLRVLSLSCLSPVGLRLGQSSHCSLLCPVTACRFCSALYSSLRLRCDLSGLLSCTCCLGAMLYVCFF